MKFILAASAVCISVSIKQRSVQTCRAGPLFVLTTTRITIKSSGYTDYCRSCCADFAHIIWPWYWPYFQPFLTCMFGWFLQIQWTKDLDKSDRMKWRYVRVFLEINIFTLSPHCNFENNSYFSTYIYSLFGYDIQLQ
jgi:hypothetical protein